MWSSSFYLGNFLGPTVAGILVESFGFRLTTLIVFSLFIFMFIVDSLELFYYFKYVTVPKKQGYIEFDEHNKTEKKIEE
jgi:MFS family permease